MISIYALIAALTMMLAGEALQQYCEPASDWLARREHAVIFWLVLASIPAYWLIMGLRPLEGVIGLRYLPLYPPVWVSSAMGLVLVFFFPESWRVRSDLNDIVYGLNQFWSNANNAQRVFLLIAMVFVIFASFRWTIRRRWFRDWLDGIDDASFANALWTWLWQRRHGFVGRSPAIPQARSYVNDLSTFDKVRAWIETDDEIRTPINDAFRHTPIAKRIAARLAENEKGETTTLIGQRGSGKSSIRNLVIHELRTKPHIRVVTVSLWPFASAEAALHGILDSLATELSRHVDTLAITGIANDYVSSVQRSATWTDMIAGLMARKTEPKHVLDKFASIAGATGLRFVLWIEDFERFGGIDGDATTDANPVDEGKLGPVRALLHLLDRCPYVSLVMADTSLTSRFDHSKIARYVERMPRIEVQCAWHVISTVRGACLNGFPRPVIDTADRTHRELMVPPQYRAHTGVVLAPPPQRLLEPWEAILVLATTPRMLKSVLRRVIELWTTLPGEIDFDHALAAIVLRECEPGFFAIFDRELSGLRSEARRASGEQHSPSKESTMQVEATAAKLPVDRAIAVRSLAHYLIPHYVQVSQYDRHWWSVWPQGFASTRIRDYWPRFLSQSPVDKDESDQLLLGEIAAWPESDRFSFPFRLADSRFEFAASQFGQAKIRSTWRELLPAYIRALADLPKSGWSVGDHFSKINHVQTVIHEGQIHPVEVRKVLEPLLLEFLPRNLSVADEITDWLRAEHVHEKGSTEGIVAHGSTRQLLEQALVANFGNEHGWQKLVHAVNPHRPWDLYHLSWGLDRIRAGLPNAEPFEGWPGVARSILAFTKLQPKTGRLILASFIVNGRMSDIDEEEESNIQFFSRSTSVWQGTVDERFAQRLFDRTELIKCLAQCDPIQTPQDQIEIFANSAISWARSELPKLDPGSAFHSPPE
ncbi:MAG: hypothetical protein IBJ18_01500 [Phycisphaerales bacterium]|nr:hypothetical protein [Phycisphaerales bacterium]